MLKKDQVMLPVPITISDRYEINNIPLHAFVTEYGLIDAYYERTAGNVVLIGRYFRAERAAKEVRAHLDELHNQYWQRRSNNWR